MTVRPLIRTSARVAVHSVAVVAHSLSWCHGSCMIRPYAGFTANRTLGEKTVGLQLE